MFDPAPVLDTLAAGSLPDAQLEACVQGLVAAVQLLQVVATGFAEQLPQPI